MHPQPNIKRVLKSLHHEKPLPRPRPLSHNLERYDPPYGTKRSLTTRLRVRLGIYPGGEEQSFRRLYQQRLANILASCPRSFRNYLGQATDTRAEFELYARHQPMRIFREPIARHVVDECCFHFWVADELVYRAALSPPAGATHYHVVGRERAGCELWMESTVADGDLAVGEYLAATKAFKVMVERLEQSLHCFRLGDEVYSDGLTKPLHYLAMCVWEESRLDARLREVLLRQVEEVDLEMYTELYSLEKESRIRNTSATLRSGLPLEDAPSAWRRLRDEWCCRSVVPSPKIVEARARLRIRRLFRKSLLTFERTV